MCGIVAYTGPKDSAPILVAGLRRLEYRGYDSAGLAVQTARGVEIVRAVGKLANLDAALEKSPLKGTTGIGHTRWATHGRPSEANAHPHVAGGIAVVHNGIIENHAALRRDLEARGVKFASDTDTEIVAHLVDEEVKAGKSLTLAVRDSLAKVRGAFAIAVVSAHAPGEVVVAKEASPLVLGIGEGEMLAASDIPALLAYTRDVVFLDDGEVATLTKSGAVITKLDGTPVNRPAKRIDWSPTQAEKGGFKHFMLKEIHEQPRAVEDTLRGRVDVQNADVDGAEIGLSEEVAKKITRVYFVACGTSAHAAMIGRYWVEQIARVRRRPRSAARCATASRCSARAISSSPSARAARRSTRSPPCGPRKSAGRTSSRWRTSSTARFRGASAGAFYTHAGPEIGVASTKCFTTQLVTMLLLAVYLGRRRGALDEAGARRILDALSHAPQQMRDALARPST